jgi:hypothetical protein
MLAGPYKQTGVGGAAGLGLLFSGSRMCNIWEKRKWLQALLNGRENNIILCKECRFRAE